MLLIEYIKTTLYDIKASIEFNIAKNNFKKANRHNDLTLAIKCDATKIIAGKKSYGEINVIDWSLADTKLYIGSYCSIAPGVQFLLGGEHTLKSVSTYPFKVKVFGETREAGSKGDIVVKDDVWLGTNAIICSGVTIGQGAVIAAGAVVTKDVEPYSVVGGNPAKIIKYRFEEALRKKLLEIDVTSIFDRFSEKDVELIYSNLTPEGLDSLLEKFYG